MVVTKKEAQVQIRALNHEIDGYVSAAAIRKQRAEAARARGDEKEALFLDSEVEKAERAIIIAKQQLSLYSSGSQTRQRRGQKR
jgi:hypothetical protein